MKVSQRSPLNGYNVDRVNDQIPMIHTADSGVTYTSMSMTFGEFFSGYGFTSLGTDLVRSETLDDLRNYFFDFGTNVAGDIFYRSGPNIQRLAIGTTGQVLKVAAGIPSWGTDNTGLANFTESINTAAPNNVIPAVLLQISNAATSVDLVIGPKSSNGSFLFQLPDNTTVGGNKRGAGAIDMQMFRATANQVAEGTNSVIIGGYRHRARGLGAAIIGGDQNQTLGSNAFVGGGTTNLAFGERSAIIGGSTNSANLGSDQSVILGGNSNTAGGTNNLIAAANSCATNAAGAVVFGSNNNSDGQYGIVFGEYAQANANRSALTQAGGRFSVTGDAQCSRYVMRTSTTDATPKLLGLEGGTVRGRFRDNGVATVHILITAQVTGGDVSSWEIKALVRKVGTTYSIIGTPIVTLIAQSSAVTWAVGISVDANGFAPQVTGAAATTIRWVSAVTTAELV